MLWNLYFQISLFIITISFVVCNRLITQKEAVLPGIKTLAQRGLNYRDEPKEFDIPIIDSAFVTMPFKNNLSEENEPNAIGCLELCMFSEGSRHQEEIIVTGTKVRCKFSLVTFTRKDFH